jgi:hypothetical protein
MDNESIPESIVLGIDLLKIIRPYNHKILNDYKNPKRKLGTSLMEITSVLYDDTGKAENKKFIIAFYFEKSKNDKEEIKEEDVIFDF